ncbi:MAG: hypothetical protein FJW40_18590 [Acidobacteria bacterium]|nr:hypothetical protein [Acidobacteriota bacterium]
MDSEPLRGALAEARRLSLEVLSLIRAEAMHRESVQALVDSLDAFDARHTANPDMCLEHRLIHVELLAHQLHAMPEDAKVAVPAPPALGAPMPQHRMLAVPEGMATLGAPLNGQFTWDVERGENQQHVPAFEISRYKVANGEYLLYVQAAGAAAPRYWESRLNARGEPRWFYRGVFTTFPLPLNWPVYVTHQEADAYAAWRGMALPTEAQWHRAAYGRPDGGENPYPWGADEPGPAYGNFNFHRWDAVAVDAYPRSASAFGAAQMVGNGWEWTRTPLQPFEGYTPPDEFADYPAACFDGSRRVLKGGSARTASRLLRRSFRHWTGRGWTGGPETVYSAFRLVNG